MTEARNRSFLVVVDDTEEWHAALRYACRRAQHSGGRLALLHVVEPAEFQQWMAVEDVIREERREAAEKLLHDVANEVIELTGLLPTLYVREGDRTEELLALIDEEPSITVLVLGASPSSEGPGPLIQHLMARRVGQLRIPVTVVPGRLSLEEIDLIT